MSSLELLTQMVKEHLGKYNSSKWIIAESPLGGRGLFATQNIAPGEIIFADNPLIHGPRSGNNLPRGCTVCSKLDSDLLIKCSKCALLLCSERCRHASAHQSDCSIIASWNMKVPIEEVDNTAMSRALAAIRALLLNDSQKQFMTTLAAHDLPRHGIEIRNIEQYFDIPDDSKRLMIFACCALDTNAYEIAIPFGKKQMSIRGLYPVSGLLNSNCVPNTRHIYNSKLEMVVSAVKPIKAGTEIFTSYTGLLWGTPARQIHLQKTKHFQCVCARCADRTEFGTNIGALRCFRSDCLGSILPIHPLVYTSPWQCLECDIQVPSKNIFAVQNALGSMLAKIEFKTLTDLEHFLLNRVHNILPKSNQIVLDLQCRFIFGIEEHNYPELPESQLALKESLCRSILRIMSALQLGDATLRGRLLYHLHATLAERARRHPQLYEDLKPEIGSTIEQAFNILQDDISAPSDLVLRRRYLGPIDCDNHS